MAQSEILSAITPALSWLVLPPLLTTTLLNGLYHLQVLTPPATPVQAQVYKQRTQATVLVAYFVYTVYLAFSSSSGDNFYQVLGVDIDSDTDTIKRSFRKLARIYHPDKVGASAHNEAFFVELRRAHDTLVDTARRAMYDRFGKMVLQWNETSITQREFFWSGFQGVFTTYIYTAGLFSAVGWLFRGERWISLWQTTTLLIFVAASFSLLLSHTSQPLPLRIFFPRHTINGVITALHQTYSAVIMASSHIRPHLPVPNNAFSNTGGINYERKPAEIRKDLTAMRNVFAQHLSQTAQVQEQAARSVDISLFPLRPLSKASAETLQDAAARAALRSHDLNQSHDKPANLRPSAEEEAYIYLMSKAIYRSRLTDLSSMQGQSESQTAPSTSQNGKVTASMDPTEARQSGSVAGRPSHTEESSDSADKKASSGAEAKGAQKVGDEPTDSKIDSTAQKQT